MDIRKEQNRNTIFMKGSKFDFCGRTISVRLLSPLLVVAGLALNSQAQIVTLSHLNSSAQVNTASSAGMFNWTVDGQNQLAQQWFWYRVGTNGPEAAINTISAPSISTPDARTLNSSYLNGSYGVSVNYFLTGFSPGSGQSHLSESISITNATASSLDFHFFQYSDFDLGGTTGGDTIQLGKNNAGLFNEADQSKGPIFFSETGVTPGANHGEAALFNSTLVKLNNGVADTLNDNAGPLTGDATWALEWDFTIDPFSSVGISKQKVLTIPEPSGVVLISLGIMAYVARRSRKTNT
jgi:hypothetical protein